MSIKTIHDLDDASLRAIVDKLDPTSLQACRLVCKTLRDQVNAKIKQLTIPESSLKGLLLRGPWYRQWPALKKLKFPVTLHLKELEVTPEDLEELAAGGSWDFLEELDLSWYEALTEDGGKALAKLLARCLALKKLVLLQAEAEQFIEFGSAGSSEIMAVKLPLLEEFEGNCNNLNASVMRALAGKESPWPALKILSVRCRGAVNTHFRNLTKANFPLLERFTFYNGPDDVEIDVESMRALRDALDMRWHKLKRVEVTWADTPAQVAFLEGNLPLLEEITLDRYHLDANVLRAFAVAARNGRLKLFKTFCLLVELGYSDDDEDSLQYIEEILRSGSWPNLQNLEVSIYNCFDDENIPFLVSALAQAAQANFFPALRSLKLIIDDTPSSDIETIFQHSWPTLEELTIILTDDSTKQFKKATANLPCLKLLTLSAMSSLSEKSLTALLSAPWPALDEIADYSGGQFNKERIAAILEPLQGQWEFYDNKDSKGVFRRIRQ